MNAAQIAGALGRAKRAGDGWLALCPAHSDRNPSLKLIDADTGDVAVHCFGGCGWQHVRDVLKSRGLLSGEAAPIDRVEADKRRADRDRKTCEDLRRRVDHAKRLWSQSLPVCGTVAETYLQSRGLTGPWPATLRFHPNLVYQRGLALPGLVAAITCWPDRSLCGIHRTFLRLDGAGKAGVATPRKALGVSHGAAIRLAAAAERMVVAEGVETALSVMTETGIPAWAAISAGGIERLSLPDRPIASEIIIAADNDPTGLKAAKAAAQQWTLQGRQVRIAIPEKPGADFNDLRRSAVQ